ncbi:ABC transporter ATP-binding protein [Actinomadura keratinilytica]
MLPFPPPPAEAAADDALRTHRLGRDFAGRTAVHALDLRVRTGEIYGLLGPNGSGKSTTVRMLTTQLRPTRGSARIAGADLASEPGAVRRRTGTVLQAVALDPLMTGRALLTLQGRAQALTRRAAHDRAAELLATLGAESFADTPVGKLSGGQRRRVDLATALVQRPAVLFLDEPTTGLDPASCAACGTRSAGSSGTTASPSCSPPSTWRRPTSSATGSASSAPDASSPPPTPAPSRPRRESASCTCGSPPPAPPPAPSPCSPAGASPPTAPPPTPSASAWRPGADGRTLSLLAAEGLHADSLRVDEPTLEDVFLRLAPTPEEVPAA